MGRLTHRAGRSAGLLILFTFCFLFIYELDQTPLHREEVVVQEEKVEETKDTPPPEPEERMQHRVVLVKPVRTETHSPAPPESRPASSSPVTKQQSPPPVPSPLPALSTEAPRLARQSPTELPAETLHVDRATKSKGYQAIQEGKFPVISIDYDNIGFDAYVASLHTMGARLFLGDLATKQTLAEIVYFKHGEKYIFSHFDQTIEEGMDSLATRPRRITNEKQIDPILTRAREQFGGTPCILVYFPVPVEAAFIGGLASHLERSNLRIDSLTRARGRYTRKGDRLCLHLLNAHTSNNEDIDLDLTLVL